MYMLAEGPKQISLYKLLKCLNVQFGTEDLTLRMALHLSGK